MSEAEVGELRAEVRNLKNQMEEVRHDVRTILDLVQQGKGARWAMTVLAALASTAAAIVGWVFGVLRNQ